MAKNSNDKSKNYLISPVVRRTLIALVVTFLSFSNTQAKSPVEVLYYVFHRGGIKVSSEIRANAKIFAQQFGNTTDRMSLMVLEDANRIIFGPNVKVTLLTDSSDQTAIVKLSRISKEHAANAFRRLRQLTLKYSIPHVERPNVLEFKFSLNNEGEKLEKFDDFVAELRSMLLAPSLKEIQKELYEDIGISWPTFRKLYTRLGEDLDAVQEAYFLRSMLLTDSFKEHANQLNLEQVIRIYLHWKDNPFKSLDEFAEDWNEEMLQYLLNHRYPDIDTAIDMILEKIMLQ